MNDLIIVASIGFIAAPVAAFVTWFLSRGKQRDESTSSMVTASGVAVDAIHEVLEVLREQNIQLTAENKLFRAEIADLKVEIDKLSALLKDSGLKDRK